MTDVDVGVSLLLRVHAQYPPGSEPIDLTKLTIDARMEIINQAYIEAEEALPPTKRKGRSQPRHYYQTRASGCMMLSNTITPEIWERIALEYPGGCRTRFIDNIRQYDHPYRLSTGPTAGTTLWMWDSVYASINACGPCHFGPITTLIEPYALPRSKVNSTGVIITPSTSQFDLVIRREEWIAYREATGDPVRRLHAS